RQQEGLGEIRGHDALLLDRLDPPRRARVAAHQLEALHEARRALEADAEGDRGAIAFDPLLDRLGLEEAQARALLRDEPAELRRLELPPAGGGLARERRGAPRPELRIARHAVAQRVAGVEV